METRFEKMAQFAAIVALVAGCFLVLQPFVTALLSAAIVCFSTWPVYVRIEQWLRGRRSLAALAMTLLLILIVVLPIALLALTLADNVAALIEQIRGLFAGGLPNPPDWIASLPLVGDSVDGWWRELAASREKLAEVLQKIAQPAQAGLFKSGLILGEGVLQLSLIAFIGFFFYRDGPALMAAVRSATHHVAGNLAPSLLQTVGGTIQGVVYGLVGTAIAQGLVAVIGFLNPVDVVVNSAGTVVYYVDGSNSSVVRANVGSTNGGATLAGQFVVGANFANSDVDGYGDKARFYTPSGIALSADGKTLYVASRDSSRIVYVRSEVPAR